LIYLDTSALVKLYYQESDSARFQQLFRKAPGVGTASLSYAEVFSAFNRKLRDRGIDRRQYDAAAQDFDEDWRRFSIVPLSEDVLRRARTILERQELRAGDAVQLASAVILSGSTRMTFASADRRLNEAARAEGLSLVL